MSKKRMREYGLSVGRLETGILNSISDVPGLSVGHVTLISDSPGSSVRTGVTAILPHQGDWFRSKAAAASYVINGYGKTSGLVQVDELGFLESPVMLTNTFSVPAVAEGTLRYMMNQDDEIGDRTSSLNVVTGECNDKHLNDMRGLHVRPEHAEEAIWLARQAAGQPAAEGAVGAGTGMVCFGWKGGIGTSSRKVYAEGHPYHVGVLVLTNFGNPEDLHLLGQPIGERLLHRSAERQQDDGSIMIVIATDLPLDARQLKRIAKRAGIGLARTGSIAHHGSGDIVIAFSNGNLIPHSPEKDILSMKVIREDGELISQCFRAAAEATEEAIGNSMFMAETTQGQYGRTVHALPVDEVMALLR